MTETSDLEFQFSVIIPTIWKCTDNLLALSRKLFESDQCGQLLIIDNQGMDDAHDTLRDELRHCGATIVRLPYNVFVNPAWNIGVCLAKYDRYLLLNDDVQLYESCLSDLAWVLDTNLEVGLVGFAPECVSDRPVPHEQPATVESRAVPDLVTNFGCCMAGRTEHYQTIPRSLKLFSGDNWLFYASRAAGRSNYAITNKRIQHLLSVSSGAFPERAEADWNEFQRLWRERRS
ncbi:MAG: glycosyltransferase [Planctomycetaceae bacterium]|nr:glycosyltransferase [Planctomycetaceae bacterium]